MINLEELKADREKGTAGPWHKNNGWMAGREDSRAALLALIEKEV